MALKNTHFRRFFSLFLLFSNCLSPAVAASRPQCSAHDGQHRPAIADCYTALELIPAGTIEFSGTRPEPNEPMEFLLPTDPHQRTISFPAEFRHNSCVIQVRKPRVGESRDSRRFRRLFLEPPPRLASELYFNAYPRIKAGAEKVMTDCFRKSDLTSTWGHSIVHSRIRGRTVKAVFLDQAYLSRERTTQHGWDLHHDVWVGAATMKPTMKSFLDLKYVENTHHRYQYNAERKIVHFPPQRAHLMPRAARPLSTTGNHHQRG